MATIIGQYLRAAVRHDKKAMKAAQAALDTTGWHDSGIVINTAFLEALALKWPPNRAHTIAAVTEFAQRTVAARELRGVVPERLAEVIKHGLGDDVDIDGVPRREVVAHRIYTLCGVADDLRLKPGEVDQLIARAEDSAKGNGFKPTEAAF